MRGEQFGCGLIGQRRAGSPPHARGTVKGTLQGGKSIGITPACAGNSLIFEVKLSHYADHPRMRGEQSNG